MIDPARSRRRPRNRLRVALIGGLVVLLALVSVGAARDDPQGSAVQAGVSPVAADPIPLGLRTPVQAWMKGRERKVIDLNNALVPIVQEKSPTGRSGRAACARVLAAAKALTGRAKAPNAQVDTLARTGLAKIQQGAATCLAGNTVGGKQLITQGLAERTAATEQFDETLEGE